MRVTQSMLAGNSTKYLSQSYQKLDKYQEQIVTGKKYNRPSDDPVAAIKGLSYQTELTEVEQYKRNISEAYKLMDSSEAGISQASDIIQRIKELTIQGTNGTNSPDELKGIGAEIGELREELVGIANMQVSGKYVFNGAQTTTPPIKVEGDGSYTFDQSSSKFMIEVSKGIQIKVNSNSQDLFGPDLFQTLESIENSFNSGNVENADGHLGKLDDHFNQLLAERSDIGARYNRLEMVESRINDTEMALTRMLSENQDVDIEEAITNLTIQENIHRASLAVSSKLIQPTLLDFLR